jgi:hypothetical protein
MQFFFDVISPYAYLAWKRIGPLAAACGRAWVATPVLFAAMLDAWGHKGPAEIGPSACTPSNTSCGSRRASGCRCSRRRITHSIRCWRCGSRPRPRASPR